MVKNPPIMQKTHMTWVRSPGWEDPLEEDIEPTLVFLPEKSHGQRSLAGYSPRGRKELDTTEVTGYTCNPQRGAGVGKRQTGRESIGTPVCSTDQHRSVS